MSSNHITQISLYATTKQACASIADSDQSGRPPILITVFAVRSRKAIYCNGIAGVVNAVPVEPIFTCVVAVQKIMCPRELSKLISRRIYVYCSVNMLNQTDTWIYLPMKFTSRCIFIRCLYLLRHYYILKLHSIDKK